MSLGFGFSGCGSSVEIGVKPSRGFLLHPDNFLTVSCGIFDVFNISVFYGFHKYFLGREVAL